MLEKKVACTETIGSCLLSDKWLAANGVLVKLLGAECQLGGFSLFCKNKTFSTSVYDSSSFTYCELGSHSTIGPCI